MSHHSSNENFADARSQFSFLLSFKADTNHTYTVSDQCRMHLLLYHSSFLLGLNSFFTILYTSSSSPFRTHVDGVKPRSVSFDWYPGLPPDLSSALTASACRSSMLQCRKPIYLAPRLGKLQEGMDLAASDPCSPGVHQLFHRRTSRDRLRHLLRLSATRHSIETSGCARRNLSSRIISILVAVILFRGTFTLDIVYPVSR